jgi:hypothetical protein
MIRDLSDYPSNNGFFAISHQAVNIYFEHLTITELLFNGTLLNMVSDVTTSCSLSAT